MIQSKQHSPIIYNFIKIIHNSINLKLTIKKTILKIQINKMIKKIILNRILYKFIIKINNIMIINNKNIVLTV